MSLHDVITRALDDEVWSKKTPGPMSAERLMTIFYKEHNRADKSARKRGVFHPSGLASCRRAQQFELIYAKQTTPTIAPALLRIFDQGHATEVRLVRAISKGAEAVGGKFTPKIRVEIPELLIAGELDGILELPSPKGKPYRLVVDFKTIGSKWFKELTDMSLGYKWQFTAYMFATKIPQTICYYENKDTQWPKEFFLRFSEARWEKIRKRVIDRVLKATAEGRLLPRDPLPEHAKEGSPFVCKGTECSFYQLCYSDPEFEEADQRTEKQRKRLTIVK